MFESIVIIAVAAVLYVFSQGGLTVIQWAGLLAIPAFGVLAALLPFFHKEVDTHENH